VLVLYVVGGVIAYRSRYGTERCVRERCRSPSSVLATAGKVGNDMSLRSMELTLGLIHELHLSIVLLHIWNMNMRCIGGAKSLATLYTIDHCPESCI
jgi:hypothetical protein